MEGQLRLLRRALVSLLIITLAGCGRTSLGTSRRTGPTDARVDQDRLSRDAAPASGAAAVAAFAHALGTAHRCDRRDTTDDSAWADQFDDTDQACLARLLQENDQLAQCTIRGSAEVEACLLGSGCAEAGRCDTALLFDDTPLIELVESYCPASVSRAYRENLRAAHFCRP